MGLQVFEWVKALRAKLDLSDRVGSLRVRTGPRKFAIVRSRGGSTNGFRRRIRGLSGGVSECLRAGNRRAGSATGPGEKQQGAGDFECVLGVGCMADEASGHGTDWAPSRGVRSRPDEVAPEYGLSPGLLWRQNEP